MTTQQENGPSKKGKSKKPKKKRRMTTAEFRRRFEEAKAKGEDTTPILREWVVDTIEGVREGLKGRPE